MQPPGAWGLPFTTPLLLLCRLELCFPQIHMLKSWMSPQNGTLFGDRVFTEVMRLQ